MILRSEMLIKKELYVSVCKVEEKKIQEEDPL